MCFIGWYSKDRVDLIRVKVVYRETMLLKLYASTLRINAPLKRTYLSNGSCG